MVIALLLSDGDKPLRYTDLSRVALQCLYGAHSMCKALSILQFVPSCPSATLFTLPSQRLSAFDAHVGDCSCQTRAQMLWELVQFYNIPEKKDTLNRAITMLEEIRSQAALLLQEIERNHGKLRSPTLRALKTLLRVWQRIGFAHFLDIFCGPSDSLAGASILQTTVTATPPDSSDERYQTTSRQEWDIDNLFLVARFLTLCFILSECKIAKRKSAAPFRMVVRADVQRVYVDIGRELESLGLLAAQRSAMPFDSKVKLNAQCDAMQGYVAFVTTDWVKKAAHRLCLIDLQQSLSNGLIDNNCRRMSCVAAYASILVVRASWLTLNTPLLVAIQRFCSHGEYHNIYYRITRNPACSSHSFYELGEPHWFDFTLVSDEDFLASPWATQPHVVMICMSGEGTIDDFRRLLLDRKQGDLRPSQPHKGACQEIVDLVSKLNELNFARYLTHFFAHHNQFPFALPDDEDPFKRVSNLIQRGLGKRASDTFNEARDGSDYFGAGRSMAMFTMEHLLVEFPGIIWKEMQGMPTVYGCKLES